MFLDADVIGNRKANFVSKIHREYKLFDDVFNENFTCLKIQFRHVYY